MPPIQPISPLTPDTTANITGGAGNLTAIAQTGMEQAGANRRQSQAIGAQDRLAQMDQEFQREMTGRQEAMAQQGQSFQAEQANLSRQHDLQVQEEQFKFQSEQTQKAKEWQVKLQQLELERSNAKRQGMKDMLPDIQNRISQTQEQLRLKTRAQADAMVAHGLLSGQLTANISEMTTTMGQMADAELAEMNGLKDVASQAVANANLRLAQNRELFRNPDPIAVTNALIDGVVSDPGFGGAISRSNPKAGDSIRALVSGAMADLPADQIDRLRKEAAAAVGGSYKLEGILSTLAEAGATAYSSSLAEPADKKHKSAPVIQEGLTKFSEAVREASMGLPRYRDSINDRKFMVQRSMTALAAGAPEAFEAIVNKLPPKERVVLMASLAEYHATKAKRDEAQETFRSAGDEAARLQAGGQSLVGDLVGASLGAGEAADAKYAEGLEGLLNE